MITLNFDKRETEKIKGFGEVERKENKRKKKRLLRQKPFPPIKEIASSKSLKAESVHTFTQQ